MNPETKDALSSFAIFLWGIGMLVIGNQLGTLNGWLFWYPLGLLTLPCAKYGMLLLSLWKKSYGASEIG